MTFQRRRGDPATFLWNLKSTSLPTVHNRAVLELRHLKTNKSWGGANTEVITTRLPLHDWIWIWLFGYITFFSLWTFTKLEKETDVLVKLLFKNNSHVMISENSNWDQIVLVGLCRQPVKYFYGMHFLMSSLTSIYFIFCILFELYLKRPLSRCTSAF